jgi:hypothetical protein
MRCVHCAKTISIQAKVCPYCDRETESSKEIEGLVYLTAIASIGVGYLTGSWIIFFVMLVVSGIYIACKEPTSAPVRKIEVVKKKPVAKKRVVKKQQMA